MAERKSQPIGEDEGTCPSQRGLIVSRVCVCEGQRLGGTLLTLDRSPSYRSKGVDRSYEVDTLRF